MEPWSNIEVSADDPEVIKIDRFEEGLKDIPGHVQQIRELITGLEVCHFKFQRHIEYIKEAIANLKAGKDLRDIGANHIRHGEDALVKDKTGRTLQGHFYVKSLKQWIGDDTVASGREDFQKPDQQIVAWLGAKKPEKERLVGLLIARLLWDWNSYEALLTGRSNKELEFQVCRMDICHYNFPDNINQILKGIGALKAVDNFEGCGSFNANIKSFVEQEFSMLNDSLRSTLQVSKTNKDELLKRWLIACLAKTIKEQVGLTQPIDGLVDFTDNFV